MGKFLKCPVMFNNIFTEKPVRGVFQEFSLARFMMEFKVVY